MSRRGVTEAVADTTHRLDNVRLGAQFAPQGPDVYINRPLHHDGIFAQCGVDQLRSLEYAPRLPNERIQKPEFAACHLDRVSLGRGSVTGAIHQYPLTG